MEWIEALLLSSIGYISPNEDWKTLQNKEGTSIQTYKKKQASAQSNSHNSHFKEQQKVN